jgi:ferrous iron transport protein A
MEKPLSEMKPGERAVVTRVTGGRGILTGLRGIGLREGKTLCLVTRHPLGGPFVVEVDGRQISLGRGIAAKIFVEIRP